MRVAIIRADIPQPIFLADLEPKSQVNPMIETGQSRYQGRLTPTQVEAAMALYNPASLASTADITFPVTITGLNQTLKLRKLASDSYVSYLIPTGVYATRTTLLAAINSALNTLGVFTAVGHATNLLRIGLQTVTKGAGQRIQYDSTGGGSTANTPLALAAGGANFTVPAGTAVITALIPVGGPIDVSSATTLATLGSGLSASQLLSMQDFLAPRYAETDTAVKCFQVGYLADLRSANWNPDYNRIPPIANGPAVSVLADDGVTAFTAPLPTISNAQFNVPVAGAVTITGTGLASAGSPNAERVATTVKFLTAPDPRFVKQAIITATAGGVVSATSIVIPASKVPSGVGVGTQVQVQYTSLASNLFTLV